MSAEAAEGYLARNLGRIRRTPEIHEEPVEQIDHVDDMILDMALSRLDAIEDFTATELDFFARGEEEERVYLMSLEDP